MIAENGLPKVAHVLTAILEALAALHQLGQREAHGLQLLFELGQPPAVAGDGEPDGPTAQGTPAATPPRPDTRRPA